jgi:hypothetical protein
LLDHFPGLHRIERQRFLTQDVLPILGRGDDPRLVEFVGQRDVDGVDFRVFEQSLVGFMALENFELVTPGTSRGWISTCQRDQPPGFRRLDARN